MPTELGARSTSTLLTSHRPSAISAKRTTLARVFSNGNFTTSTLTQEASRKLGFATERAQVTLDAARPARQPFALKTLSDFTPQLTSAEWLDALPVFKGVLIRNFITPDAVNFMRKEAGGIICLTLHPEICDRLNLPLQTVENTSRHSTPFTVSRMRSQPEPTATGQSCAATGATTASTIASNATTDADGT